MSREPIQRPFYQASPPIQAPPDPRMIVPVKRELSPDIKEPTIEEDLMLMDHDEVFDQTPVKISLVRADLSKNQRKKQRKLARQKVIEFPQPTLSP